jgi:S-layer protein transport system outer membrane protein
MKITSPHFPIISVTAIILATGLSAHRTHAETLADVVAYAYETNPGVQSTRAALRALDESYVQARGGYGLNISASVGASSYSDTLSSASGNQPNYAKTDNETLSIVQPLYTGGRVHSQLNEAEAQILAGRETLRRGEIDLLVRVVTAYVDVLRDEALLKVNQDTITVLEKEVADTLTKFSVREVTMTDVAQAKARLAQANVQLASARASLAVTRAQFIATVGQSPGDLAPPPPLPPEALPTTVDQAFDSAENHNPQLLAAKYAEQKSKEHIAEVRAGARPSVSAQFQLQRSPYLPYSRATYNNVAAGMVTLNQPIFTGGQLSSQIRQAIEANNGDRLSIDDTRQQIILGVSSAWERLSAARSQLKSLDEEVASNRFSFYGNRQEAKIAIRTTIEVLNAELELSNSQQSLISVHAEEYVDRIQLLAAMGMLDPLMLSAKTNPYDSAAHFRQVKHAGETPLEWPVRVLDAIGTAKVAPPPPASISEARPTGSAMPPTPETEAPIQSILSTLNKPPPEPK